MSLGLPAASIFRHNQIIALSTLDFRLGESSGHGWDYSPSLAAYENRIQAAGRLSKGNKLS